MQSSLAMPLQRNSAPWRRLILLTLLVLLVHGLLLGGLSAALSLWQGAPEAAAERPVPLRFSTRTIAPAPAPVPVPTPVRSARPRPVPPPVTAPATAPAAAAPATASESPTALPPNDAPAVTAAAPGGSSDENHAGAPGGIAGAKPASAAAQADTPPQPAPDSTAPAAKLQPPAPVRMLFDGRGEERGFIKYAASAELLWLPLGAEYSARLEISAWGIRLRTWTSKGTLGEAGLQPTRFGDKPRGAEQATHFQRDKGIISFSANNPDVPLQAGAQDKLSALLQLSALVAGEPERYPSGSVISFQAADAHRAEPWSFQAGALEPLELPGGNLMGLKFSKQPSVEFDQRIEVWLAPEAHYLPVRLRITEANGAFADLLWRNTQKPD